MTSSEITKKYWLESAEDDWTAAGHLFEKGDYPHALFFGHLTVEKVLKAIWAVRVGGVPPNTHRLTLLAEKAEIELTPERQGLLETVTDFNMEARYPDEKFSFKRKCTKEFAEKYLKEIAELKAWIQNLLP